MQQAEAAPRPEYSHRVSDEYHELEHGGVCRLRFRSNFMFRRSAFRVPTKLLQSVTAGPKCYNPSLREARGSHAHVSQVCHQRVNELQDVRAVFKSVLAVVWRKVGQLVLEAQGV